MTKAERIEQIEEHLDERCIYAVSCGCPCDCGTVAQKETFPDESPEAARHFYSIGWRVRESKLLCPTCADKK